jgi:hypothetical protein
MGRTAQPDGRGPDISDWRLSGDINFKFPVGTRAPGRGFICGRGESHGVDGRRPGLTNVFGPVTNRLANSGGTIENPQQL